MNTKMLLAKLKCSALLEVIETGTQVTLRFKRTKRGDLEAEVCAKLLKKLGADYERLTPQAMQITITALPPELNTLISVDDYLNQLEPTKQKLIQKYKRPPLNHRHVEVGTELLRAVHLSAHGLNYATGIMTYRKLWAAHPFAQQANADLILIKKNFVRTLCQLPFVLKHTSEQGESIVRDRMIATPNYLKEQGKLSTGLSFLDADGYQEPFVYAALYPQACGYVPMITAGADRSQFYYDYDGVSAHKPVTVRTTDHYKYNINGVYSPVQIGNVLRRVCFVNGGRFGQGAKIYEYQSLVNPAKKITRVVAQGQEDIRGDARLMLAIQMFQELEVMASIDDTIGQQYLAPFKCAIAGDEQKCQEILLELFSKFYPLVECIILDNLPFESNGQKLLIEYRLAVDEKTRNEFTKAAITNNPAKVRQLLQQYPQLIEPFINVLPAHPIPSIISVPGLNERDKIELLKIFYAEFKANQNQIYFIFCKIEGSENMSIKKRTPIMLAAELGLLDVLRYLLTLKPNVHIFDETDLGLPHTTALELARRGAHTQCVHLLKVYGACPLDQPIDVLDVRKEPGQITTITADLNNIAKVICASYSVGVVHDNQRNCLRFNITTLSEKTLRPIHPFQIPILLQALGEQKLNDVETNKITADAHLGITEFIITLDGKAHRQSDKFGFGDHDAFGSPLEVLARLIQLELTTVLVDAQNHFYWLRNAKRHPVTGKGATHPSVILKSNKLSGFAITVTINANYQVEIEVTDQNGHQHLDLVKQYLTAALQIEEKIECKEKHIKINMTATELIKIFNARRINWSAAVIITEKGGLLMAGRTDLGVTPPGGYHCSPYFDTGVLDQTDEFNITIPVEKFHRVVMMKRYGDQAIYLIPAGCWELNEVSKAYARAKKMPFKAAENEFKQGTELVVPPHYIHNVPLRNENAVDIYFQYCEQQIAAALMAYGVVPLGVHIMREYLLIAKATDAKTEEHILYREMPRDTGRLRIVCNKADRQKLVNLSQLVKVNTLFFDQTDCMVWDFVSENYPRKELLESYFPDQPPTRENLAFVERIVDPSATNYLNIVQQICAATPQVQPLAIEQKQQQLPAFLALEDKTLVKVANTTQIFNMKALFENYFTINREKFSEYVALAGRIIEAEDRNAVMQYVKLVNKNVAFQRVLQMYRDRLDSRLDRLNLFLIELTPFSLKNILLQLVTLNTEQLNKKTKLLKTLLDHLEPQYFVHAITYLSEDIEKNIKDATPAKLRFLLEEGCWQQARAVHAQSLGRTFFNILKLGVQHYPKAQIILEYLQLQQSNFCKAVLTQVIIDNIKMITAEQMKQLFSWGADVRMGNQQLIKIAQEHKRSDLMPLILAHAKELMAKDQATRPAV